MVRATVWLMCISIASCTLAVDPYSEWQWYLGDPGRSHYSRLDEINTENVHQLEVAWTYRTGDARQDNRSEMQSNPIVIDGVLYTTTPGVRVIALNAASGEKIWEFDPYEGAPQMRRDTRHRGVTFWENEEGEQDRIFVSAGLNLYALDARTGSPVAGFGLNGKIDMRTGIDRDTTGMYVHSRTPGVIYNDLLIFGSRVLDGTLATAPGDIRAFDVRTGEMRWIFHTIPHPGEFGYETWPPDAYTYAGGANSWAGMALDKERGIVYAPTGSPASDFWGGNRKGENLYGNSLIALNAETGERIWHFQVVRHDLWDRDLPAPPNLVTVEREGKKTDAVAQVTKSGHVFVFDRESGESLFPLEEKEYPPSDIRGEEAWPTQVFPLAPKPFARQTFSEDDYTDISPEANAYVRNRMEGIKKGGQYIPPSLEGVLILPGFDGGAEWGGAAYDIETGVLYVNSNEMPWIHQMIDLEKERTVGGRLYAAHCAACHGGDRAGDPSNTYPSLLNIRQRMSRKEMQEIIANGKGIMPGFPTLSEQERMSISAFLRNEDALLEAEKDADGLNLRAPFGYTGFNRFFDQEGYPAIKPPWGTLNAINLNTGLYEWTTTLGEFEELTDRGIPPTGTENYGGPVVTAGGLLFIAATKDEKIRAFDKATGNVLWEAALPAGGYATPSTYEINGKQYLVIGCGGGKMGTKSGDSIVAFALP